MLLLGCSGSSAAAAARPLKQVGAIDVTGQGYGRAWYGAPKQLTPTGWPTLPSAPGTDVSPYVSQQVMVADRTSGSTGTWARYEWVGTSWERVDAASGAHFGKNGVVPANQRVVNDGRTPAGTFPMVETLGPADPGTRMPYRTVGQCSWWIGIPGAPDYNRFRDDCALNGQNLPMTAAEPLYRFTGNLYRQVGVIGFNWDNPRQAGGGSGFAIFLHYATGSTAGCVGLDNSAELTSTIRWMDPAKNPTIVILS